MIRHRLLGIAASLLCITLLGETISAQILAQQVIPSDEHESSSRGTGKPEKDILRAFPGDIFLSQLEQADIDIINHFGANAPVKLRKYIATLSISINAMQDKSIRLFSLEKGQEIEDDEWKELISSSSYLKTLEPRSLELIRLGGFHVFSSLNYLATVIEDSLIASLEEEEVNAYHHSTNSKKKNIVRTPTKQQTQRINPQEFHKISTQLLNEVIKLKKQGDVQAKITPLQKLVDIYETYIGRDSLYTAYMYRRLAHGYYELGKDQSAKNYYDKALSIFINELGEESLDSMDTLQSMSRINLKSMANIDQAKKNIKKALAYELKLLGEDNLNVLLTSLNTGF